MEVLVLYYSKTGNTKKLAQAIASGVEEVEGVKANLKSTQEVTKEDFFKRLWCNCWISCIFWCNGN